MGMDKTEYAALFKRFENSTNENGFGIGMPLALSILKGQGGDIDVDFGGRGEGTTFYFKIFSFKYSTPNEYIDSRRGIRFFPISVSPYSTLGGTTGYTFLNIRLSSSKLLN